MKVYGVGGDEKFGTPDSHGLIFSIVFLNWGLGNFA